jgi:transposase-like protein
MAYTPEFRAQALVTLEANGGNILQTATQLGVGEATIRAWVAENSDIKEDSSDLAVATAEILPDTREEFIDELKTVRNKVLRQLHDNISDLKAREAAVTLGILIDKTELLEGNATSRTQVVGDGETVNEAIERITREIESRINGASILEVESSNLGDGENESTTTTGELVELASDGRSGIRQDEIGSGVVSNPSN